MAGRDSTVTSFRLDTEDLRLLRDFAAQRGITQAAAIGVLLKLASRTAISRIDFLVREYAKERRETEPSAA
jgi:hypothetical protein